MQEVLEGLNQEVGVKGSMIMTRDGMVVASAVQPGVNADVVAAMAANVIISLTQSVGHMGKPGFSKFVFTASHGKLVFTETGSAAYLVVLCDKNIKLDLTMLAISAAARKIAGLSSISS